MMWETGRVLGGVVVSVSIAERARREVERGIAVGLRGNGGGGS